MFSWYHFGFKLSSRRECTKNDSQKRLETPALGLAAKRLVKFRNREFASIQCIKTIQLLLQPIDHIRNSTEDALQGRVPGDLLRTDNKREMHERAKKQKLLVQQRNHLAPNLSVPRPPLCTSVVNEAVACRLLLKLQ